MTYDPVADALGHSIRVGRIIDFIFPKFEKYFSIPRAYVRHIIAKDYIVVAGLWHDVGKLTKEYEQYKKGKIKDFHHHTIKIEDFISVFMPSDNLSTREKSLLAFTAWYTIRNHHEAIPSNQYKGNVHFKKNLIQKLWKETEKLTDGRVSRGEIELDHDLSPSKPWTIGFVNKVLELVSFADNVDAEIMRNGAGTTLSSLYKSNPFYKNLYKEIEETLYGGEEK